MDKTDLINKKFGKLLVIRDSSKRKSYSILWECLCDCGRTAFVSKYKLTSGHTGSCGCSEGYRTHGMSHSRIYKIWNGMRQRCQNPNNTKYSKYGGRGISICNKWQTFEGFYEDMKDGYADNLSIDRIDNDKGYYKENCKWSTITEQQNNRGLLNHSHLITFQGETLTMTQWAKKLDINYQTLANRINTYQWSIEKAFAPPAQPPTGQPAG